MYEYWLLQQTEERVRDINREMARIRLGQSVTQRRSHFSLRLPKFGLTVNKSTKRGNYVNTGDTVLAVD